MSQRGVELLGVTIRYAHAAALDHVDLDAGRGAVHALIGKNGAGKTTVARVIAGLVLPTAGDLRIAGVDARSPAIHRVRRSLGFLPQDPVLYENLSGTEFLLFIRDLYGLVPSAEPRLRERLRRMDLDDRFDAPIRTYSVGMRKKIALLASLLPDPTFWILDEPFAALDEAGARVVEDEMARIRDDGGLVLFTAHDADVAERLADRVCVLERGRKLFEGSAESFRAARREVLVETAPALSDRTGR